MGPTQTTVLWDVLVEHVREVGLPPDIFQLNDLGKSVASM